MEAQKVKEIEGVLEIQLANGKDDLGVFEEYWKEFFRHPLRYKGTVVADSVRRWYVDLMWSARHRMLQAECVG